MTDYPFWPYPLDPARPRNKLESGFWGVHALYPAIYQRVDILCRRLISEGRKRYAVDAFFNQLEVARLCIDGPAGTLEDERSLPALLREVLVTE